MLTHQLWQRLSPDLANEILTHAQKTNKKLYHTALDVMGPPMGLRPVKILELPKKERHTNWAGQLRQPALEPLSLNLFSHWLMTAQNPMLITWLEAIDAPHDGHGFLEKFPPCPSQAILQKGIDALLVKFPAPHVLIYLTAFNQAEEAQWKDLTELVAADPRLLPAVSGA